MAHASQYSNNEPLFWLDDKELLKIFSSEYWNNEDIEKEKEWFILDGNARKLLKYLDEDTTYRRQFESILRFATNNNLRVEGVGVDVAAGVCWTTALLSRLERLERIYALEISKHRLLKIAPAVFGLFDADQRKITRVMGSFYDIKLPDKTVDFCFMSQAFHHADDPHRLLAELHRILKPSGFILVIGESPIYLNDIFKRYIKNITKMFVFPSAYKKAPIYKIFPSFKELYPPDKETGDYYYQLADYECIFKSAGFLLHENREKRFTTFLAVKC